MQRHIFSLSLEDEILESLRRTSVFLQEQGTLDVVPDLERAVDRRHLDSIR